MSCCWFSGWATCKSPRVGASVTTQTWWSQESPVKYMDIQPSTGCRHPWLNCSDLSWKCCFKTLSLLGLIAITDMPWESKQSVFLTRLVLAKWWHGQVETVFLSTSLISWPPGSGIHWSFFKGPREVCPTDWTDEIWMDWLASWTSSTHFLFCFIFPSLVH